MTSERYRQIENWTEDDLSNLPEEETDYYEYKSSLVGSDFNKLKKKIQIAASAFWNTGGGVFIVGINDDGVVDGGIPEKKGNQKLRDWVDQIIVDVEPVGPYTVQTIASEKDDSLINTDKVVLVIGFGESFNLPHMAPDNKYYMRAGAHSMAAGHYLVEAIRARRGLYQPMLRGLIRFHDRKANIFQLIIVTANQVPALDVRLTFNPLPRMFIDSSIEFPFLIPIIDQQNPYKMDLATIYAIEELIGDTEIYLQLDFQDAAGRKFNHHQHIQLLNNISPIQIGTDIFVRMEKSFTKLTSEIVHIRRIAEHKLSSDDDNKE
jgi:hypothetical protein